MLEVDGALLNLVRGLCAANDSVWTRFAGRAASRPVGRDNKSCFRAWRAQFDCGWNVVRQQIYKNPEDRSAGLMPLLDRCKGDLLH